MRDQAPLKLVKWPFFAGDIFLLAAAYVVYARGLNTWWEMSLFLGAVAAGAFVAIAPFVLAGHDVADRFVVPQHLYGRETEVRQLLDAFEAACDGPSSLMLVAGYSGIGKTTLIQELYRPIVRQRGSIDVRPRIWSMKRSSRPQARNRRGVGPGAAMVCLPRPCASSRAEATGFDGQNVQAGS